MAPKAATVREARKTLRKWGNTSASSHNKPASSSAWPSTERLQSLCSVTWENENIRGLIVGIHHGEGATSSKPTCHNCEARPGWIELRTATIAETPRHVQMELIGTRVFPWRHLRFHCRKWKFRGISPSLDSGSMIRVNGDWNRDLSV